MIVVFAVFFCCDFCWDGCRDAEFIGDSIIFSVLVLL